MDIIVNESDRFKKLKSRTKHCVCKYCGGTLSIKRLIFSQFDDARIELYCKSCNRIEFGVEQPVYQSARFFVEETNFNAFHDLDDNDMTKQMTIAKVAEIMTWQNKNLGFQDDDGFKVPVHTDAKFIGECLVLTGDEIDQLEDVEHIEEQDVIRS